jgi:V/A-type H+/Na+-transporting ATPase subunit A
MNAKIRRLTGALAEASPLPGASLYELARVGERGLLGEIIRVRGETATIQVFEETSGVAIGEPVERTGASLCAELGPGLLGTIFDGIGRPLRRLAEESGSFLEAGAGARMLDPRRVWTFEARRRPGDPIKGGDVLGSVVEPGGIEQVILAPPGCGGVLAELRSGKYSIDDPIGALEGGKPLSLAHRWPIRIPRPVTARLRGDRPFVTGQRVFDLLFPVAEGGSVAVPGGFGTGKTVIEQSLAKYADADMVVYVGCGERGNEMAELLDEFPKLIDPHTLRPVMERTVMIVNTSNMPVAAREASIYLGATIAEYFRDMGHRVAMMADSLSRWAEALREIGARLQEMPGEEGYPTYLASRLGALYERSGRARVLGAPERTGAFTLISAISPPGGDLSEPVTQASLRVCGALWALDPALAHQRQFPAVDWETSYSAYVDATAEWFRERGGREWTRLRAETLALLARDRELREIAELVGPDALDDKDRVVLECARIARECVIGQSSFDPADARSPPAKTHELARLVLLLHQRAVAALDRGAGLEKLAITEARTALLRARSAPEAELDEHFATAERTIEEATKGDSR